VARHLSEGQAALRQEWLLEADDIDQQTVFRKCVLFRLSFSLLSIDVPKFSVAGQDNEHGDELSRLINDNAVTTKRSAKRRVGGVGKRLRPSRTGQNTVFILMARKMINSYRPLLWMSLAMVVAAFGTQVAAQAQTVDSATAAKLDFLNDRLNAFFAAGPSGLVTGNFFVPQRTYGNTDAAGPPPEGKPQFAFNILAPFSWDSNANSLPSGGTSALQFSPDLRLGFTDHFAGLGGVKISGVTDLVINRYSNSAGTDASPASYSFEIQHVSGKNDQEYQPFLAFSSQTAYNSDFSTDTGTVRKLYGGFDKVWNFGYFEPGEGMKKVPKQATNNHFITLQAGLSAQVGRSFATSSPDSTYLKVTPSFGYNSNNGHDSNGYAAHWSLSLGANIAHAWKDAAAAAAGAPQPAAERDWTVSPLLTVLFSPPVRWFRWDASQPDSQQARNAEHLGNPTITLQIAYSRFSSNVTGKSYDAWAIGPSLGASWKF
jgi:hypothetical protein